jgi:serine/threonine-protein kinase RsbW
VESLKVLAVVQNLPRLISPASEFARKHGFTKERISELELALEEAVTNICLYAYGDEKGPVEVRYFYEDDGDTLIVEIRDSGKPFDALAAPSPALTGDLEDRELGGLGVFFIRTLTDDVEYHYSEGENVLRMAFYRVQEKGAKK